MTQSKLHGGTGATMATEEEWPELGKLPTLRAEMPTLPPEMLPEALRGWLEDAARHACIPLEMVAVSALVGLATVVGRTVGIRPEENDSWTVIPNLWGGVVVPSGMLKSHSIEEGLRPVRRLAAEAWEAHGLLSEEQRAETAAKRYYTSDATTEKLGVLLQQNPRGLLVVRDELAGWLAAMDRQGREGDRQFYLEAWNGDGSFTVDRIGRGTTHIDALCLSVVGGIQPGVLTRYVTDAIEGGAGADGLLQRLQLLVWPDGLPPWSAPNRPVDTAAFERAMEVYRHLDTDLPAHLERIGAQQGPHDRVPWLGFVGSVTSTPGARSVWREWRDLLEERLRAGGLDEMPAFASHLSKYRSLMPSIALLYHLVDVVEGATGPVSETATVMAAGWCEYLEQHARKVYAPEIRSDLPPAAILAKHLEADDIHDGMTVRAILRKGWHRLGTAEALTAAVEILEPLGWCRLKTVAPGKKGGRSSPVLRVHPDLRPEE